MNTGTENQIADERAGKLQFGLKDIIYFTIWSAVSVSLIRTVGIAIVPIVLGTGIMILNVAGRLKWLQSGRRQTWLVGIAWTLFIVSLCLRVTNVTGPYGWQQAWVTAESIFAVFPKVNFGEQSGEQLFWRSLYLSLTVANVMALLSLPVGVGWIRDGKAWIWMPIFVLSVPAVLICLLPHLGGPMLRHNLTIMREGWYVWVLSFLLLIAAFPMHWKYALASFVTIALWCVWALF